MTKKSEIMKNMNIKMLIVACMLSVVTGVSAVNYNFDKSVTVPSISSNSSFDIEQSSFGEMNYQQGVASGYNMISSQKSVVGKSSLISVEESASQSTTANNVNEGARNITFSRTGSVEKLYDGFDSGVEVGVTTSIQTINLNGAAKLPGQGGHEEPWPPVGEGLWALLLFSGIYSLLKRKKSR
jgi:hypothetical protein